MKAVKYLIIMIVAVASFASASPADAQINVRIGNRQPRHRRVVVVRRPMHRHYGHGRRVVVRHY